MSLVAGKTYGYMRGYDQMREAYDGLINRLNNPWTEIKPLGSKEEVYQIIEKCRKRVEASNEFLERQTT